MSAKDMAVYMAERRERRRQKLIDLLGGICIRCGTTKNLEFDHRDPVTKGFNLSGKALDKPWSEILIEAEKCQLLCHSHHLEKTIENGDIEVVEHGGGVSGKRNCSCVPCKTKKAEYMRAYGHPARNNLR